jgi:hypothetical protein
MSSEAVVLATPSGTIASPTLAGWRKGEVLAERLRL